MELDIHMRNEDPCHLLGVLIDQELQWKEHVNYVLHKGAKWVMQYRRLEMSTKGVSAMFMWRFYLSVAILLILYAADLFLIPESQNS